jgi:hypothetical protein
LKKDLCSVVIPIWPSKPQIRIPRLTFVLIQAAKNLEDPDFQTFKSMFLVILRALLAETISELHF